MFNAKVNLLILLLFLICSGGAAHAATVVTPEMVAAGIKAAPEVVNLATTVCKIPLSVGQILYLPFGALELGLSPLPGPTVTGGATKMFKGIGGVFGLAFNVLELPFVALKSVGSVTTAVAK